MSDARTTVHALRDEVAAFVAERDWERFHNPKDLAIGLLLEAAELVEPFQWQAKTVDEVQKDPRLMDALADELADVLTYVLNFANVLDIDLSEAFQRKMGKNADKYPAHLVKGSSAKYTEYHRTRSG